MKKLVVFGCSAWVLGFAAFIVGLNLSGTARSVLTVAGSIVFLAGLFCVGIVKLRNMKDH